MFKLSSVIVITLGVIFSLCVYSTQTVAALSPACAAASTHPPYLVNVGESITVTDDYEAGEIVEVLFAPIPADHWTNVLINGNIFSSLAGGGLGFYIEYSGSKSFVIEYQSGGATQISVTFSCYVGTIPGNSTFEYIISPTGGLVTDGRLNLDDMAALAVVFQTAENIDVYAVNPETNQGTLAIRFPIAALPTTNPSENLVLADATNPTTGDPIVLSMLTTGELQVNATQVDDSPYVFIWQH